MKPILPTLKEKKRYLLFNIITSEPISKQDCAIAIQKASSETLGTIDCANAGITFFEENYKDNSGIIRVNTKYVDHIKLALASIQQIGKQKVTFNIKETSGLIGKVKEKLFNKPSP